MLSIYSSLFLVYSISHFFLFLLTFSLSPHLFDHLFTRLVCLALVYDNALISLGSLLFPSTKTNKQQQLRLFTLSQPRFLCHAVLVPFLFVELAELGERGGLEWCSHSKQVVWIVSVCIAVCSLLHHLSHPHLTVREPNLKGIVTATLKEKTPLTMLLLIGPSILLIIFAIYIGVSLSGNAGMVLWVSAVLELLSNGGPPSTMLLTGNAGEVVFLAGIIWANFLLIG